MKTLNRQKEDNQTNGLKDQIEEPVQGTELELDDLSDNVERPGGQVLET